MKYLLIILSLILFSCEAKEKPNVVWSKVKTYEVVDIQYYKTISVAFRDVETGEIWPNIYVSRYCAGTSNLRVGDHWEFVERRYQTSKEDWRELIGADYNLCYRIQDGKYKLDWQMVY